MLVNFDFLHVMIFQSTGEFVLVDVLELWIMFVVAVWSRAAHGPPEEAVLVWAATAGKTISHFKTQF